MAERSKAADLSSVIFGCVGSNPTASNNIYILYIMRVRSSVVEHGIADPMVTGSIPVVPFYNIILLLIYMLDWRSR